MEMEHLCRKMDNGIVHSELRYLAVAFTEYNSFHPSTVGRR
jgi:hypothetical protein